MEKYLFTPLIILFCCSVVPALASQKEPDQNDWQLINEDARGNLLYVSPVTEQKSGENPLKVWLKFETKAENSPSPMLFLSELDCEKGLIRRLEVKLYNPTCSSDNELVQTMSFDGKWDTPAQGIEQDVKDFLCRQNSNNSL